LTKIVLAEFWVISSQKHLVTLIVHRGAWRHSGVVIIYDLRTEDPLLKIPDRV
jgi:hypothetical protein